MAVFRWGGVWQCLGVGLWGLIVFVCCVQFGVSFQMLAVSVIVPQHLVPYK